MGKMNMRLLFVPAVILAAALLCVSCASYKSALIDAQYGGALPQGAYTVIKYGGNHDEDFATFCLLIPEDTPYKFEIFRPDFEYTVTRGVGSDEALKTASVFVSRHPDFLRSGSRSIMGPDGRVVAYEVKAFYRPLLFGTENAFDVTYSLRADNVIEVRIYLEDVVINYLRSDSGN
jgi:hypothetical protein